MPRGILGETPLGHARGGDNDYEFHDPGETFHLNKYAQTVSAALLGETEATAIWLPLSRIAMSDLRRPARGEMIPHVRVELPRWLAKREGLI